MTSKYICVQCFLFVSLIDFSISTTSVSPTCVPDVISQRSWLKSDYPNPQIDIGRCGRNCRSSWVCDPGKVISTHKADQLDVLIDAITRSGKCDCSQCSYPDGYNISIAIVPSINRSPGSDAKTEARNFALYLRQNWNFQKCGNNIVIFLSRDDRQIYTEAGSKTYQVLTLECIEKVYNDVKSKFTNGEYYEGLREMIDHYKQILANGNCDHVNSITTIAGTIAGIVIGGFFVIFIIAFVCICRSREGGCHGGAMVNGHHHHHHHGRHSWGGGGGGGGGGFSGGGSGDGGGGGGGGF